MPTYFQKLNAADLLFLLFLPSSPLHPNAACAAKPKLRMDPWAGPARGAPTLPREARAQQPLLPHGNWVRPVLQLTAPFPAPCQIKGVF